MARVQMTFVLAVLATAFHSPAQNREPDPRSTSLSIRRVVLYKHGIGYFERQGPVRGDAVVSLSFRAAEMKDVLKSLFAVDLNGGRIATIDYDSKDPIEKQMEDVLFRLPEANVLTSLLDQLRGSRIRVGVGARSVEGDVLGVEPVHRDTDHGRVTDHELALFRDDGSIETVNVFDAAQIEIVDEAVRAGVGRLMEIYAKARRADRKVVSLRAQGVGQRSLRVGYIVETPIWKTSYRLLLDADEPPLLQAWAIVENRTDDDWNDVRMSLVAGSPLSFVMDLYTSYYPARPVVSPGLGAVETRPEDPVLARRQRGRPSAPDAAKGVDAPERFAADARAEPRRSLGELFERSVVPAAQGVEVGELFAYEVEDPVTIDKGKAALVPILLERLTDEERLLYFSRELSKHPSHAILLKNTTELTLESGPVTVFEGATCLGEGVLGRTLGVGMHAMLPYAIESGVEVEHRAAVEGEPISHGVLADGILTLSRRRQYETRYEVRNRTDSAHVLALDHPRAGDGYELVEPRTADDVLPGAYRFRIDVPATGGVELVVCEEQPLTTQVSVVTQGADQIRFYARQPYLSQRARELLAGCATLMEEMSARDREIAECGEERARRTRDLDEIRKNLGVLRDTPEERKLRDLFLARLTGAVERIDALDASVEKAARERGETEKRLKALLGSYREQ